MAKFKMLPPDVPVLEIDQATGKFTGRLSSDFYDLMKGLERLGVLDMFDVNNTTPPTNLQVLIFNAASGKFIPGAN
jgi:hypothetical protein